MNDQELDALLPEALGEAARHHREPDLEEILEYLNGELSDAEASAFLDRLSLFPGAARMAAELADDDADTRDVIDDPEQALRTREAIRRDLVADGILPDRPTEREPSTEEAVIREFPTPQAAETPRRVPIWTHGLWAALVAVAFGFGTIFPVAIQTARTGPDTDVDAWALLSEAQLQRQTREEKVIDTTTAASHVLRLTLGDTRGFTRFEAALVDGAGVERWRVPIRPKSNGSFHIELAADELEQGRYVLWLDGLGNEGRDRLGQNRLGTYPFLWQR